MAASRAVSLSAAAAAASTASLKRGCGFPQGQRKGTPCVPGSQTPGAYGRVQPKPTNRSRQAALMIGRLPPQLQAKPVQMTTIWLVQGRWVCVCASR